MENTPLTIRRAAVEDAPQISQLATRVFVQSYQHPYSQQDMNAYLNDKLSTKKIMEEINSTTMYYYVAQIHSIVGFVKFNTYMWTPRFKGKITFEIERLYIQKGMERKNIGSRLMQRALDIATQKNYTIVWLSVWENNAPAIAFHQKHGFVPIGDGVFTLGNTRRKYLILQKK